MIEFSLVADGVPQVEAEVFTDLSAVRSALPRQAGQLFSLSVGEPHVALPALLARLEERGLALANLTTRHASLEDVFVHLAGRHIHEEGA